MLIRAELKDFSLNMIFLANYVQAFHKTHYVCDFCFFSSRKRRVNKDFSFYPSFPTPIGNLIFLIYINRGWLVPACPELVSGTRSGNSLLRWRLQLWLIVQKGSNNIKHKHTLKKTAVPPSRAHVVRLYDRHVPPGGGRSAHYCGTPAAGGYVPLLETLP